MLDEPEPGRLDFASDYGFLDPVDLKMRSCNGWSEKALQDECDYITRCAQNEGGRPGRLFRIFPRPGTSW